MIINETLLLALSFQINYEFFIESTNSNKIYFILFLDNFVFNEKKKKENRRK